MKKINCILLVDDDATTNFLNEELIEDLEIAEHVYVALNGLEALDFLNNTGKFQPKNKIPYPRPNIIFLDINMPLMGGFEFLTKYNALPKSKKAEVVIVFLTTSDAHKDRLKVVDNEAVRSFIEKPLRKEELLQIREDYINDFLA